MWLQSNVGLPEYENVFREKKLYGKCIPRLATDNVFLQKELGITKGTHRKKINVRASEIILFGLPQRNTNFFSDTIVLVTVLIASFVIFYAFHQKSMSRKEVEKLTNDLEFLKQAEHQLRELQENGGPGTKETELLLREEIETAKKEAERLLRERSKHEQEKTKLQLLEQEVHQLRIELAQAKKATTPLSAPLGLQNLLVLTYRKEVQNFHLRKQQALLQMQVAKEACEKVNKTRRAVFGSLRLAHGQSIDAVDQKILNAKTALADVTKDLQERQSRWQQIEEMCNFNVVSEENNIQRVMLSDSLLYGSKGTVGSLNGYDSPLLGLSETQQLDQLDNEVEEITRQGRLIRSGTESSSSPETQRKNGHTASCTSTNNVNASPQSLKESPSTPTMRTTKSPKIFRRNNGGSMKANSSHDSLIATPHGGSSSSLNISIGGTEFHSSTSAPGALQTASEDNVSLPSNTVILRKNVPAYSRSNTDPSVQSSAAGLSGGRATVSTSSESSANGEGNGRQSPSLQDHARQQRSGSRPVSMVVEKETGSKKKKKGISLPRFGSSQNGN